MPRMVPTEDICVRDPTGDMTLGWIRRTETGFVAEHTPRHAWMDPPGYGPYPAFTTDSLPEACDWLSRQPWPRSVLERGYPPHLPIRTRPLGGGHAYVKALSLSEVPFGPLRAGVVLPLPHLCPYRQRQNVATTLAWVIFDEEHRFCFCLQEVRRRFLCYERMKKPVLFAAASGGPKASLRAAVEHMLLRRLTSQHLRMERLHQVPLAAQALLDLRAAQGHSPYP